MEESFVKLIGVKKAYHGERYVLRGIDMEIRRGEIHCLAGENGSGKSTLIKIISGVHEPSGGEVYIGGERMEHLEPLKAIEKGVRVIYQDFAVFPNLTVAENIAIGRELGNMAKTVKYREMRKLALEAMGRIGLQLDPDEKLGDLSVASRQAAAICRAIIDSPELLILDEPTTALTTREVQRLWDVIKRLRDSGVAVLLIDHKFDEIREIADRVTVIRNGEVISTGLIGEYDHRRFRIDLTGKDFASEVYSPEASGENILTVEDLSAPGKFEHVSFKLDRGDIVGITGLLGSGRTEIAEALFGITPAESGRILLHGKEIRIRKIRDAVRNEIGFVPEDRLTEGLFPELPVTDNASASSLRKYRSLRGLRSREIRRDTENYIREAGIKASSPHAKVKSLSGGNAQKVVISKWLNTDPKLLILAGPSVGMDIGAKAEVHGILRGLAGRGVGILMVTDDLAELTENCNKILVVRNGRIVLETDNSVSKKRIEQYMTGEEEANE